MKHSLHQALSVGLIAIVLVSLGLISPGLAAAAAASAAGTGPDAALTPTGDWEQLAAGANRWYSFEYAGDGSQITVRLEVFPEDSATFAVWTPEEVHRWELGQNVQPIGRGSDDPNATGSLEWSGNFSTSGTYYVVVERAGSQAGTSHYLLEVTGDGVSLTNPTSTPAAKPVSSQTKVTTPSKLTGKLVFQTTYGGPFYTINVDGSGLQRITNGIDPVWSPDGHQIAFVRWDDPRGVWVVNADGSNAHRIFDWSQTRFPSWSPDGQQIVFSRQYGRPSGAGGGRRGPRGGGGPGGPGGGAAAQPWQLGIVNPVDGTFWEPLPNSDVSLTPAWSPDGERIVYSAVQGLRIQSVDGKESYQLTSDPMDTSSVWSPSGEQVSFVHRQHDHWEIYVVDVNTGQRTRLTDTPAWADGTAANSVSPAWSPEGRSIAFLTDRTGKWQIWVMNADGSNQRPLFDTELQGLTLQYAFAGERAISWTP
jgi:Tol biopolymer transport system component